ncbi:sigma factor-like helix-turn-helix DNA-binding protein [Allosphingosinicella deserti]|uniref:RNA polymerase sigma factor 70 region 4 type 2 domain-containing protein n=1 Tax=Allosphingosinicella deserti TaxID=2116704 RepID=A0A2P7QZF0_9SPHN|nr:hypothetical protein C7I55_02900 [Sphingomonas deserti]
MIRRAKRSLEERATEALERSLRLEAVDADSRSNRQSLRPLERAIIELPSPTREIFLAHRCDGQSYVQIAEARALRVADVEQHVARALFAICSSVEGDERPLLQSWWSRVRRWFS